MEVELDLITDHIDENMLMIFCEKALKGNISDMEWRDKQLDSILSTQFGNRMVLLPSTVPEDLGYKKIESNYVKYFLTKSSLYGCIDCNDITTSIKNIAFITRQIHIESGKSKATILILETPKGKIIKDLYESGSHLSIIPRVLPDNIHRIYRLDII